MTDADAVDGQFYWVWIDTYHRYSPDSLPELIVAQANRVNHRLYWEGCGTDEGIRVIQIVAMIDPPPSDRPAAPRGKKP
jgi:hypothetical protein